MRRKRLYPALSVWVDLLINFSMAEKSCVGRVSEPTVTGMSPKSNQIYHVIIKSSKTTDRPTGQGCSSLEGAAGGFADDQFGFQHLVLPLHVGILQPLQ